MTWLLALVWLSHRVRHPRLEAPEEEREGLQGRGGRGTFLGWLGREERGWGDSSLIREPRLTSSSQDRDSAGLVTEGAWAGLVGWASSSLCPSSGSPRVLCTSELHPTVPVPALLSPWPVNSWNSPHPRRPTVGEKVHPSTELSLARWHGTGHPALRGPGWPRGQHSLVLWAHRDQKRSVPCTSWLSRERGDLASGPGGGRERGGQEGPLPGTRAHRSSPGARLTGGDTSLINRPLGSFI